MSLGYCIRLIFCIVHGLVYDCLGLLEPLHTIPGSMVIGIQSCCFSECFRGSRSIAQHWIHFAQVMPEENLSLYLDAAPIYNISKHFAYWPSQPIANALLTSRMHCEFERFAGSRYWAAACERSSKTLWHSRPTESNLFSYQVLWLEAKYVIIFIKYVTFNEIQRIM